MLAWFVPPVVVPEMLVIAVIAAALLHQRLLGKA
jgi:hypothetical protein